MRFAPFPHFLFQIAIIAKFGINSMKTHEIWSLLNCFDVSIPSQQIFKLIRKLTTFRDMFRKSTSYYFTLLNMKEIRGVKLFSLFCPSVQLAPSAITNIRLLLDPELKIWTLGNRNIYLSRFSYEYAIFNFQMQ